jgi:acetolactate synthase-1/2/3 large subunit
VIAIGTDFDGVMTQNWTMQAPPVLVAINVDRDDASKNYKADVTIVGDALPATAALSRRTSPRDGLDALGDRMQALSATVRESVKAYDEHALQFLDDMGTVVSDDSFIAVDMCIPGYWLGGFHAMSKPRRFAYPLGWGTLGFGFPASLGAAMASSSPTVCICGDGGFLYCCGELATLAQQQLALTVVVVNDYGYGMLRFDQQESQDEPFGVDLETPDFVAMAQSFGIEGRGVEGFGPAFAACLADCLASRRPQVLVVRAALSPPPTTSPRWPRRKGVPQA